MTEKKKKKTLKKFQHGMQILQQEKNKTYWLWKIKRELKLADYFYGGQRKADIV